MVVEGTVKEKICQIGYYRFGPFRFELIHNIIIGSGVEFNKDFPNHTDFGFDKVFIHRQIIKIPNNPVNIFANCLPISLANRVLAFLYPLFI
ncbi:hypothetical protein SDC9_170114 [bioreactor metagenome]|uniref:Uncharacterized protein n=1 Tax=bioreactor metagenome TaxID=1076179 RepID=A0A645G765_9ZZZZ